MCTSNVYFLASKYYEKKTYISHEHIKQTCTQWLLSMIMNAGFEVLALAILKIWELFKRL